MKSWLVMTFIILFFGIGCAENSSQKGTNYPKTDGDKDQNGINQTKNNDSILPGKGGDVQASNNADKSESWPNSYLMLTNDGKVKGCVNLKYSIGKPDLKNTKFREGKCPETLGELGKKFVECTEISRKIPSNTVTVRAIFYEKYYLDDEDEYLDFREIGQKKTRDKYCQDFSKGFLSDD
jgi:hypothetical protein